MKPLQLVGWTVLLGIILLWVLFLIIIVWAVVKTMREKND